MSWRIIYIEESEHLKLYLDNIKIIRKKDEVVIPLSDINAIVVDNTRTTLSAQLLNHCTEYNVAVFICDHHHLPCAMLLPTSGNYRATKVMRTQLAWRADIKAVIWQHIVRTKILRQREVLEACEYSPRAIDILTTLADTVESGDPTNCEGLAAKTYFRALFGARFLRDEENTLNAALNYGYSIVRSQVARAVVAHGFNAHIGIFHKGPGNPFNLADDLMEPLRPIIDYWVVKNINSQKLFVRKTRLAIIAIMTQKVLYRKKRITVIFAINDLVARFMDAMETGDASTLTFPHTKLYDL